MKKYFLLSFALVLTVACIGFATFQPQAVAEVGAEPTLVGRYTVKDEGTITVTGTGKYKVSPDLATISLSVETRSRNIEDAQKENAEIVRELTEALSKHNVHESDITTSWFNIYPDHDHYGGRVLGHRVSNSLSVKVRDIGIVGKAIDAATSAGASIVSGVQFGIEENSNAYGEALAKAVESAKQKAARLSGVTGLGALQIVSIKEITNGQYGFHPYYYARATADGFVGQTQIMHDNIEITATVEVKFKMLPVQVQRT